MKKRRFKLLSIIRSKKTISFSILLLIFFILVFYYKNNIKFYERVGKVLQWSALPGIIVKYLPEQVDLDNFLNIIDYSYAFMGKNKYEANLKDWELFNKKYFYKAPKVFTIKNEMLDLNTNILTGSYRIMESSYILKNKYLNENISKRINVLT